MKVDYIIIGCGLAGISFCEQLRANNKSFVVFDNTSQQSSTVAGGLYNPVVLKRFTSVWKSKEQLQLATPFYKQLEEYLNIKLDYKLPILRKFTSIEEQNNWFAASDKPNVGAYISTEIIKNYNEAINAKFGLGKVLQTGRIDTSTLINRYKASLKKNNLLLENGFNHNKLRIKNNTLEYDNIISKNIVFAEGFGLKQNPFFNHLPLKGTKGELLTIYAPELKIDFVLKSNVFLIPLGKDLYRVGATYEWDDKTSLPTQKGKDELLEKLNTVINCKYKIVNHVAGMRPTVIDRRPLVGSHQAHKNLYILNGLGTRGVMIAPYVAKQLYEFIEENKDLASGIDINRFN